MRTGLPTPSIRLCGPATPLRQRIDAQLQASGLGPTEETEVDDHWALIVVVCPAPEDRDGLGVLATVLEHEALPEQTAYLFVIPGQVSQLQAALEAVPGRRYCAVVPPTVSSEALPRQIALAARWLDTCPSPMHVEQPRSELMLASA